MWQMEHKSFTALHMHALHSAEYGIYISGLSRLYGTK